jgi:hypothetical protein
MAQPLPLGRQQSIRLMSYQEDPARRRSMWPADPETEIELDDVQLASIDAAYVNHIMREYDQEDQDWHDQEDQDDWMFMIQEDDSDVEGDIGIIDATSDVYVSGDSGAEDPCLFIYTIEAYYCAPIYIYIYNSSPFRTNVRERIVVASPTSDPPSPWRTPTAHDAQPSTPKLPP